MNRLSNYKEYHQSIFFFVSPPVDFAITLPVCAMQMGQRRQEATKQPTSTKMNKILTTIIISLKKWCVAIFCRCMSESPRSQSHFVFISLLLLLSITSISDRYDFYMEFIDTFFFLFVRFVWVCMFLLKCTAQLDFECVGTIVKNWQNYLINSGLLVTWKRQQSQFDEEVESARKCEGKNLDLQ